MSGRIERVLVLNVGKPSDGAIAERPEAYALRQARPDYVVFVCSAKGADRAGTQEFVRRYADLVALPSDRYEELLLDEPDDLAQVYEQACETLGRLRATWSQARILVDYTGGTKSMSAGLAMAAIDQEDERVELRLVRGQRGTFATVIPGTESFRPVSGIHDLRARRWLGPIRAALERYDYAVATRWLDELLERGISSELAVRLQRVRDLCRAFDAWIAGIWSGPSACWSPTAACGPGSSACTSASPCSSSSVLYGMPSKIGLC
jgi:CRISPR-associated protein (TIGR02710 family)